jgi:hypothetical protein
MAFRLRSNPGGLRDEAVQAADLFLDPGQEILESRGRAPGDNHRWKDLSPQRWRTMPLVVLVNGGTASAAEIIAGALQDHDRALLAGDTTYGKGIVQTVFPLTSETALRMTTARWYTPSGRSIQGCRAGLSHGRERRRRNGGGGFVRIVRFSERWTWSEERLLPNSFWEYSTTQRLTDRPPARPRAR